MTVQPADDAEAIAVAQFTLDGEAFGASPIMGDRDALDRTLGLLGGAAGATVLDLACGPGIVATALAEAGFRVIGMDLTPRMLELAADRARRAGVDDRCTFRTGRMVETGLGDASVDGAVVRYALHHADDPGAVADELIRVVRPGARIVAVDMVADDDPGVAAAYDDAERRRDPSHVRNLTGRELASLFEDRGCVPVGSIRYRLAARVDRILAGSQGPDHDGYRQRFEESLSSHRLGVDARRHGDDIAFHYPILGLAFVTPTMDGRS